MTPPCATLAARGRAVPPRLCCARACACGAARGAWAAAAAVAWLLTFPPPTRPPRPLRRRTLTPTCTPTLRRCTRRSWMGRTRQPAPVGPWQPSRAGTPPPLAPPPARQHTPTTTTWTPARLRRREGASARGTPWWASRLGASRVEERAARRRLCQRRTLQLWGTCGVAWRGTLQRRPRQRLQQVLLRGKGWGGGGGGGGG